MKVYHRMTANPITAKPHTTYREAMQLMQDNHVNHLPILTERGKLVGLVTYADMLGASPSPVTSLSVFEIYSLLDKIKMDQIMSKPVLAVEADCSLPSAARFMLDNDIGCLPVMDGNKMVGIITDTDIYKALIEVMGGGQPGTHVEMELPDEKGVLATVLNAIAAADSSIVSVSVFNDKPGFAIVDIKERGGDEKKLREELEKLGTGEILELRPSKDYRLLSYG